MTKLTIVMYHYVRDVVRSRYPGIKGRTTEEFRAQLDHIGRSFNLVTVAQVIAALKKRDPLPPNPALLTFDDGYQDHFTNVFPLLHERRWQGAFFPSSRAVLEGELLDVNKIQFILASNPDFDALISDLRQQLTEHENAGLRSFDEYWAKLVCESDPYDPPEVVFIKRMLQRELPESVRAGILQRLFTWHVSVDERGFAAELYMSTDQLRMMGRCGMYVGSHGASHQWLDRVAPDQQAEDIESSLAFLRLVGAPTQDWVMCYPYGASNESLRHVVRERGCAIGLTASPGVARIGINDPLSLPRVDTNELPFA